MGRRVAVLGTSAGQGATHVASAIAWEAAEHGSALLVDADPSVGTVADVLGLEPAVRLSSVWGPTGVATGALLSAALPIEGRKQLRVVAGFERPIVEWPGVLAGLAPALAEAHPELTVVVDLGVPFSAAAGAPSLGPALGIVFDAVVLVLRSDADLLARSIRLLWADPLPRARVVLMRPQGERGPAAARVLRSHLPWLPEPLEWRMDRGRMLAAMAGHRPVLRPGGVLRPLGLGGDVRVESAPSGRGERRRRLFRRRPPAAEDVA